MGVLMQRSTIILAVIAAVGFVVANQTLPLPPLQVISSDANARFLEIGINKAVAIDLPRDIKEVLVADAKTLNGTYPKFTPAQDRCGSASMQRRSTQPTSGSATARAPNSRRLIRRLTCQEWRRRGSLTRLEAAFLTGSGLATPSWHSWCRKAAMARIASKLSSMPDRSCAPPPRKDPC